MLYLGSDHAGYQLKEKIKQWLTEWERPFVDIGPYRFEAGDDYPIFAKPVAEKVSAGDGEGILICDTGEGMAIAANKFPYVRATLVTSDLQARRSRTHNDSNILVLGSELQSEAKAKKWLQIWLQTPFSNEARHERRIKEIDEL